MWTLNFDGDISDCITLLLEKGVCPCAENDRNLLARAKLHLLRHAESLPGLKVTLDSIIGILMTLEYMSAVAVKRSKISCRNV